MTADRSLNKCCYVALGSNLQSPLDQVQHAIAALADSDGITLLSCAPFYASKAIGPGEQPDYINTVVALESTHAPHTLLRQLQRIEQRQGRQRSERWGARTIDLDLLLYADESIQSATLTVPHPRMHTRNFVIFPLYDIAPDLLLPDGRSIRSVYERLTDDGLKRLYNVAPANSKTPVNARSKTRQMIQ